MFLSLPHFLDEETETLDKSIVAPGLPVLQVEPEPQYSACTPLCCLLYWRLPSPTLWQCQTAGELARKQPSGQMCGHIGHHT